MSIGLIILFFILFFSGGGPYYHRGAGWRSGYYVGTVIGVACVAALVVWMVNGGSASS